jgi:hypothetical protein
MPSISEWKESHGGAALTYMESEGSSSEESTLIGTYKSNYNSSSNTLSNYSTSDANDTPTQEEENTIRGTVTREKDSDGIRRRVARGMWRRSIEEPPGQVSHIPG